MPIIIERSRYYSTYEQKDVHTSFQEGDSFHLSLTNTMITTTTTTITITIRIRMTLYEGTYAIHYFPWEKL